MRQFADMPVSSLRDDVPRSESEDSLVASADYVEDTDHTRQARDAEAAAGLIKNEILEAERDRLRQQRTQRTAFFRWSVGAISFVIFSNAVFFSVYMWATNGKPGEAVLISFMSTSLVEVIGLGYIIARYLFQPTAPPAAANGSQADRKAS